LFAASVCSFSNTACPTHAWQESGGMSLAISANHWIPRMHLNPQAFINVIDELAQVQTVLGFQACMANSMQQVLPHGCMIGGFGKIRGDRIEPAVVLSYDFPMDYLASVALPDRSLSSPVVSHWLRSQQPVLLDFSRSIDPFSSKLSQTAKRFDFKNLLAHGQIGLRGDLVSYFSFHRLPQPLSENLGRTASYVVPHLHLAAVRVWKRQQTGSEETPRNLQTLPELTHRQKEVIYWVSKGKTNWEISKILGTSESNIKYHLHTLLRRLNVTSRSELLVKLMNDKVRESDLTAVNAFPDVHVGHSFSGPVRSELLA
jgi:transcriptional regulator EpsA